MKLDFDLKGGKIVYNDFNLNFNKPLKDQIYELQEDLLQIQYSHNYILDLGWHPELDPNGCFIIHIIKDSDWQNPLYQKKTDIKNVLNELRKSVDLIIDLSKNIEIK